MYVLIEDTENNKSQIGLEINTVVLLFHMDNSNERRLESCKLRTACTLQTKVKCVEKD